MTTILHPSTTGAPAGMELLRTMLEEAFVLHTNRLTELTVYSRLPDHGGYDPQTLDMLIDDHRRQIADTAHALQRMADGTYGACQSCGQPIPLGRLRMTPQADRCAPCQNRQSH